MTKLNRILLFIASVMVGLGVLITLLLGIDKLDRYIKGGHDLKYQYHAVIVIHYSSCVRDTISYESDKPIKLWTGYGSNKLSIHGRGTFSTTAPIQILKQYKTEVK